MMGVIIFGASMFCLLVIAVCLLDNREKKVGTLVSVETNTKANTMITTTKGVYVFSLGQGEFYNLTISEKVTSSRVKSILFKYLEDWEASETEKEVIKNLNLEFQPIPLYPSTLLGQPVTVTKNYIKVGCLSLPKNHFRAYYHSIMAAVEVNEDAVIPIQGHHISYFAGKHQDLCFDGHIFDASTELKKANRLGVV